MEITTSMYNYSYGTLYSFSFLTTYTKLQIHVKKSTIAVNRDREVSWDSEGLHN